MWERSWGFFLVVVVVFSPLIVLVKPQANAVDSIAFFFFFLQNFSTKVSQRSVVIQAVTPY